MAIKIEVKQINMVGTWDYDVENKECPICHYHLQHPTTKNIEDKRIKNIVAIGECNHGAHIGCISKWLHSNMSCPICMTTWKIKKKVSSAVYIQD